MALSTDVRMVVHVIVQTYHFIFLLTTLHGLCMLAHCAKIFKLF